MPVNGERDERVREKALALIHDTTKALADGVRHYNRAGRLLTTPTEIIECLQQEGSVLCEDPTRRNEE